MKAEKNSHKIEMANLVCVYVCVCVCVEVEVCGGVCVCVEVWRLG